MSKGGKKVTPVFKSGEANGFSFTGAGGGGDRVTLVDDTGAEITISGGSGGSETDPIWTVDKPNYQTPKLTADLGEMKAVLTTTTELIDAIKGGAGFYGVQNTLIPNGIVGKMLVLPFNLSGVYNTGIVATGERGFIDNTYLVTVNATDDDVVWQELGAMPDLSDYYTKSESNSIFLTPADVSAFQQYKLTSDNGKNLQEVLNEATLFSLPPGFYDKGSYDIDGNSSSGMVHIFDYGNLSGYKKANAYFSNEIWTATFNNSSFSGGGWKKIAEEVKPYFQNTTVTTAITLTTTPQTITTITTDVPVKARGYLTALVSRAGGTSAVGIVTVTLSDGSNTFTANYDIGRDLTSTIHLNTAKRLSLLAGTITLTANYTGTGTVTVNNIAASLE